ncbi:DUF2244 domain-containing protein [Hahella sp. HN01]|uniref:DUF2244 domain-containing protein n=1 Tax=Hahella sp. HN01 TaxID=2847262 RepID=UPI001C1EF7C2|nr:DUF2244 domain-containing protein [Hahella sp. HN01]MBU6953865.1 DUF2244 domain-containing protein [Hahella sp. HN01]
MLDVVPGENAACARLILQPNNSAGWKGNRVFLFAVGGVALTISIAFSFFGALPVLAFCGLELALLAGMLRAVSKRCASQEVILITPLEVCIEKGMAQPERTWTFPRWYTRIVLVEGGRNGHLCVVFVCKGEEVEVGAWLADGDRKALIATLRSLVTHYQHLYH